MSEVDFRTFKKTAQNYFMGLIFTIISGGVVFYFSTEYSKTDHEKRIIAIEAELKQKASTQMVLQIKADQSEEIKLIREDTKFIREWIMTNNKK